VIFRIDNFILLLTTLLLHTGPWHCVLLLIPRSFHDGGAVNYWQRPHREKATLISNGCLLFIGIKNTEHCIGQTLPSLDYIVKTFLWIYEKCKQRSIDASAPLECSTMDDADAAFRLNSITNPTFWATKVDLRDRKVVQGRGKKFSNLNIYICPLPPKAYREQKSFSIKICCPNTKQEIFLVEANKVKLSYYCTGQ
jgi:hypothetical protein